MWPPFVVLSQLQECTMSVIPALELMPTFDLTIIWHDIIRPQLIFLTISKHSPLLMLKVSFGLHQFFCCFFFPAPLLFRYLSGEQGNHSSDSSREIVMAATNLDFRGEYRSFVIFWPAEAAGWSALDNPLWPALTFIWRRSSCPCEDNLLVS